MQYAVVASFVLFLGVVYLPFLQPIFNTTTIILEEWLYIVPLVILPSIAAEVTKVLLRSRLEARRVKAAQAA
jgi:Ca2+-transporting ATPase